MAPCLGVAGLLLLCSGAVGLTLTNEAAPAPAEHPQLVATSEQLSEDQTADAAMEAKLQNTRATTATLWQAVDRAIALIQTASQTAANETAKMVQAAEAKAALMEKDILNMESSTMKISKEAIRYAREAQLEAQEAGLGVPGGVRGIWLALSQQKRRMNASLAEGSRLLMVAKMAKTEAKAALKRTKRANRVFSKEAVKVDIEDGPRLEQAYKCLNESVARHKAIVDQTARWVALHQQAKYRAERRAQKAKLPNIVPSPHSVEVAPPCQDPPKPARKSQAGSVSAAATNYTGDSGVNVSNKKLRKWDAVMRNSALKKGLLTKDPEALKVATSVQGSSNIADTLRQAVVNSSQPAVIVEAGMEQATTVDARDLAEHMEVLSDDQDPFA